MASAADPKESAEGKVGSDKSDESADVPPNPLLNGYYTV